MKPHKEPFILITAALLLMAVAVQAQEKKPLKVFILAGQSNMVGMGGIGTFPAIGMNPETAPLLEDLQDAEGNPVVCQNVFITSADGRHGPLDVSYGGGKGVRIGPEYSFGIYAHKMLGEPVLLIKTAWGGKNLIGQFRPPSAGPLPLGEEEIAKLKEKGKNIEAAKAEQAERTGAYYRRMMAHIKKVLADPKAVYPDYDPEAGYELAGFVWFQGYNDYVGKAYPYVDESKGKESARDYSEYTELLACFIRDIRKELDAPKMPFVIGVFGMGGKSVSENIQSFRDAQAATAEMPEFKGNAVNVFTEEFWPEEIAQMKTRERAIMMGEIKVEGEATELRKTLIDLEEAKENRKVKASRAEKRAARDHRHDLEHKLRVACFGPEKAKLLEVGSSQQGYHYHGSAKFYVQAGKAFAESLIRLKPK